MVAGHVAAAVTVGTAGFLRELLRQRGNGHTTNTVLARRVAELPTAELAALLRERADREFSPPVVGPRGPLADGLIHEGDMRVPLGLPHAPDPADVALALEFVRDRAPGRLRPEGRAARPPARRHRPRPKWGDGDALEGRGIDLLMAACGRTALLPALTGAGVPVLAGRLTTRR